MASISSCAMRASPAVRATSTSASPTAASPRSRRRLPARAAEDASVAARGAGLRRDAHPSRQVAASLDRCKCREGTLAGGDRRDRARQAAFTEDDVYARAPPHAGEGDPQRHHAHAHPRGGRSPHRPEGLPRHRRLEARLRLGASICEICVFPQEGLLNDPGTEELLVAACERGRRPDRRLPLHRHATRTSRSRASSPSPGASTSTSTSISTSISIPAGCTSTRCAAQTDANRYGGRVAVGHATKLSADAARAARSRSRNAWPTPAWPSPCCRRPTCSSWAAAPTTTCRAA